MERNPKSPPPEAEMMPKTKGAKQSQVRRPPAAPTPPQGQDHSSHETQRGQAHCVAQQSTAPTGRNASCAAELLLQW